MQFYSKYDFELYSNFTFFLEDPINGEQIRQRNRSIYGMNAELNKESKSNDWDECSISVGYADATIDTGTIIYLEQKHNSRNCK
jgi:hypothetical protein